MALYQPTREHVGPGHGTRMAFRLASIFGIALFLGFLAVFIWGPRQTVSENPSAGENAQAEKQASPQPAALQPPAATQPPAAPEAQQPAPSPLQPNAP
jgi:hypothetical protein